MRHSTLSRRGGGARVRPMLGQGKAWLLMCGLRPHNRHGAGCACCCETKGCVAAAAAAPRSNARGCGAVCRLQLLLLPHSALMTCCVWAAVCDSIGCGGLERLSGSQLAALGGSSRDSGRVRVRVSLFFSGVANPFRPPCPSVLDRAAAKYAPRFFVGAVNCYIRRGGVHTIGCWG